MVLELVVKHSAISTAADIKSAAKALLHIVKFILT